jgi:hypothetical protein
MRGIARAVGCMRGIAMHSRRGIARLIHARHSRRGIAGEA